MADAKKYCADDTAVCDALVDKLQMVTEVVARCEVARLPARQVLTRAQNFCYARLIRSAMTEAMPQRIWDSKVAEVPMGRAGEPSEVASVALFLASDLSS